MSQPPPQKPFEQYVKEHQASMPRKIVQLVAMPPMPDIAPTLYALLDDGTVWSRDVIGAMPASWKPLEGPPPTLKRPESDEGQL